ncbi:MAG TPA: hypothetical protein VF498_09230 [Anaerolineales bacterium]
MLLLVVLIVSFVYALRGRNLIQFAIVLVIVLLIEFERLVPGTMTAIGNVIHTIDVVNAQLPHVQIQPIVTIHP